MYDLFERANYLTKHKTTNPCYDKILAALFYQPSTRTRFSFESAMHRLGGRVISTENAKEFSSTAKGESLEDTIRVVGNYADIIALRHWQNHASERAAKLSEVPLINAGDGTNQHPTQALLDIYTIYKELGHIDGIKIAMVGDLVNGRTVRSLSYLLGKFKGISIQFISPEQLKIKQDIKDYLQRRQIQFSESQNLLEALPNIDIIYMTRIQKEYGMDEKTYQEVKGKFILNKESLNLIPKNARILHPLPHLEEIDFPPEIENTDQRIAYFRQAKNGLYIRMALLERILNNQEFPDFD